ncbi:hypothetical protein GCM10007036_45670 [Alsobacter metallidurans]|uniref:Uncharacterized protein n=1 Tax=Alsobacter metallidurans TaxID=340221 RepID=A0A917IBU2_9HYPH|nr:hypothetical protein [Alsobacter metallidurans]GGH33225.1 hypothetical protein GCM10007036_45670 [Alsobacter metallidurans]
MSQLERLEHVLALCSSARRLANPNQEPLVARLLDMLLLELGETLAQTPGHRVRIMHGFTPVEQGRAPPEY